MAAKGTIAKENVINAIKETFGDSFVGVYDKKVYIWSEENGEKVQVCLNLTCPKNPVGAIENYTIGDRIEFEEEAVGFPTQTVEITQDEENNIAVLMEKLGL